MSGEKNIVVDIRNMDTSPVELGFRVYQGATCGFSSCCRTNTHIHCKNCGFGTSQTTTAVNHKKMCPNNPDGLSNQQLKDFKIQPAGAEVLLQHDSIMRSSQAYPFYTTVSQTSTIPPQSLANTQANSSKLITQQSAMFNFVLPPQNAQYNTLYSTQNVFPNPNMFSPSGYNSFNQLDPWLPQSRLITPSVHPGNTTLPDTFGNPRNVGDKFENSDSLSCCSRIESTSVGMCSPLTAEAYKVVSKEMTNYSTKLESQNWYCNSQGMMSFGMQNTQQTSCKYSEQFPACSIPQISYLLLEQSDFRQTEECINTDEICFEPSQKVEVKQDQKKLYSNSETAVFSSCAQVKNQEVLTSLQVEKCPSKQVRELNDNCVKMNDEENAELESMECTESSCSSESDIIVEDSDEKEEPKSMVKTMPKCIVCDTTTVIFSFDLITVYDDQPLTTTTHVSVISKLSELINSKFTSIKSTFICKRCLNLINTIDCLETKLISAKKFLNDVYKNKNVEVDLNKKNVLKVNENTSTNNVELSSKSITNGTISTSLLDNKLKQDSPTEFACDICDRSYSSSYYLQKHKQYHTKSFSYYCERCGKGFTVLQKLENHLLLHLHTSRFQCEICGKRFIQKHFFNDHIKKHRKEFRYRCTHCEMGFNRKNSLEIHLRLHNKEKPFVCQYCGKQFSADCNLKTHIQICTNQINYSCDKCDKKFVLKSLLDKHISFKHENKFKSSCSVCGKGFLKESDLKKHSVSHTNVKNFKCELCNKVYKTISSLNHHIKLHKDNTSLKCTICSKIFTRKDALTDHINFHLGKKPYTCSKCNKSFCNRLNYHTHMKKHDGTLKGKSCPICNKFFINGLKKDHLRTHSGEKPFSCQKCLVSFTVKSSLNKHIRLKHNNT